jgi:signal peptidase I
VTLGRRARPARRFVAGARRPDGLLARGRGPWRVAVAEGSMLPTIRPGDWLLVDPTTDRWPRRGAIVVFREPGTGLLAIKRVAGRPGDWVPFADGWLQLADDEAWLLSDATDVGPAASSDRPPIIIGGEETHVGAPIDSRRYGPVPVTALVGRAWLRYWPLRRIGLPGRRPRRADTATAAPGAAPPP